MTDKPLIEKLEAIVGRRKIIGCIRHCDDGWRGCDACNTCGKTGTGFKLNGKFYANSEEGWQAALDTVK